jgi:hypothetical protein
LNTQTDFIGDVSSLPDDFCLVAPLSADAIDVYTQTLQLQDFNYIVAINQKLVDEQTAFNADYFAQQAVYSKL